jgi:hypothetical protein
MRKELEKTLLQQLAKEAAAKKKKEKEIKKEKKYKLILSLHFSSFSFSAFLHQPQLTTSSLKKSEKWPEPFLTFMRLAQLTSPDSTRQPTPSAPKLQASIDTTTPSKLTSTRN